MIFICGNPSGQTLYIDSGAWNPELVRLGLAGMISSVSHLYGELKGSVEWLDCRHKTYLCADWIGTQPILHAHSGKPFGLRKCCPSHRDVNRDCDNQEARNFLRLYAYSALVKPKEALEACTHLFGERSRYSNDTFIPLLEALVGNTRAVIQNKGFLPGTPSEYELQRMY